MSKGIYITPTEFVSFGENTRRVSSLGDEIATRVRSMDVAGFSFLLPNPDPILKRQGKDMRVYRDLRSDAHVGGCVRRRKAAVKALERRVVPGKAGARAARRAEDLLDALDMDRVLNEVLDAVLYGWQPLELIWGHRGGALVPLDVVGKPGEWFTFDSQAQLRFRSREQPLYGEAVGPRKFLLARQEASYANPYGFADLSMCFWPTVFKRGGLKFWVTFTEKYGTPWLVGKQPRGTPGPEVDALLDKLESMIQDAVAAIPDDSSIDILEAGDKGASAGLYKELLMFCRSEVSIALLGQNQSTEASSTHASATAGLEVAAAIRDGDARMVEATLNQLLRWVTDLNEGEGAAAPTVELFEQQEVDTVQAERDAKLKSAGVAFTSQYWKRTYKLEDGDIELDLQSAGSAQAAHGTAPAEFAEGQQSDGQTPVQAVSVLSTGADPIVAQWVRQVRALVTAHDDPQKLQTEMLDAFADLPTQDLTELMALAFELAHLRGRDQVKSANG